MCLSSDKIQLTLIPSVGPLQLLTCRIYGNILVLDLFKEMFVPKQEVAV